jgi:hypothetical protein
MLGSLPARVRELYGLPWSPGRERAFRVAVGALRGVRAVAPRVVTHGSNRRSFALVRATEAGRLERGRPTPQLPPLERPAQAVAAAASATPAKRSVPSASA